MKGTKLEGAGVRMSGRSWRRLVALIAVLVVLAVGAWLAFERPPSAHPTIDQAGATTIARDFFDHAHGSGARVANVKVLSITLGMDAAGRPTWKVNISGDVIEVGRTSPSYTSYLWLYVDAESGAVAVFAQG